jgi:hypothetical protein
LARKDKQDDSLSLITKCINDSNKQMLENDWEKVQYFRNGQMLLWQDRTGKWFPIMAGTSYDGLYFDAQSIVNYPKDPHMVTLDVGLTAKALGNPLIPEVLPAGSDDEDRDSAEKCTRFLRYHREDAKEDRQTAGRSLREQACDYLIGTGNGLMKDYFDPFDGEQFEVDGQKMFRGKIVSKVVSPKAVRTPNGVVDFDNLPWIMEETALPVDEAKRRYKDKADEIVADEDLADPNAITPWAGSGGGRGDGLLKGHVRIYEYYERPNGENGYKGRKIIATRIVVLWEGVYDSKLAGSKFSREHWHPYSYGGWRKVSGSMWCKTVLEELISLQIKLNSLWQQLLEEDPDFRGWWLVQEDSVDWEMARTSYNTYGKSIIEYSKTTRERPFFQAPPVKNPDIMGKIQLCVARMNDIVAQYETTRGNADPNVTSGKQADIMNSASNSQSTPLLTAIVNLFIAHWKKVLQLAAVHFDSTGTSLSYTDPLSNDVISDIFTPDQIQSDDVIIFGGNAFYMTPESKRAEIEKLGSAGFFGDVVGDPIAKQKYLKLLELPFYDSAFADELTDLNAAKRENRRFGKFMFDDDREWVVGPLKQQYLAASMAWMQAKIAFDGQIDQYQKDQASFNELAPLWERAAAEHQQLLSNSGKTGRVPEDPGPPPTMPVAPMDPGPPPQPPVLIWRALEYEDHNIHVAEHTRWRKTPEYEKLCRQNPELDQAIQFHIQTHNDFINQAMQQAMIQQAMLAGGPPQPSAGSNMGPAQAAPPPAAPGRGAA